MKKVNIRNFSVIAHINHENYILEYRILKMSKFAAQRDLKAQLLYAMEFKNKREVITKLNAVQIKYIKDGEKHILNLIDTLGNIDFTQWSTRINSDFWRVILLLDSLQEDEQQTIENMYISLENNLTIIPIINSKDLKELDIDISNKNLPTEE